MKQEDKELLLKDLCARLPYGVKVESVFINPDTKEHKSCGIEVFDAISILMIRDGLGEFKPYLFPLSSITEEQYKEIWDCMSADNKETLERANSGQKCANPYSNVADYYNANHLDYRGLIEKGLAIDATGLNIY